MANDKGPTPTNPTHSSAAAVSLKLPPLWHSCSLVWFAQVDAQFTTRISLLRRRC